MPDQLTQKDLDQIRTSFYDQKMVIIGDLSCDIQVRCGHTSLSKSSAVAFQELSAKERNPGSAGSAGFIARVLKQLGVKVSVVGGIGEDFEGETVMMDLGDESFCGCQLPKADTTKKVRIFLSDSKEQILPYLKVNYDLFPERLPEDFLSKIQHNAIQAIDKVTGEAKMPAVVIADYSKGIVTGPLLEKLDQVLADYINSPRRIERTLLTRRWRSVYDGKRFHHVFWDASGFFSGMQKRFDGPAEIKRNLYSIAREWFRRLKECRTLVVTVGSDQVFYFRNLSSHSPRVTEDEMCLPIGKEIYAREFQFTPTPVHNPDYTGVRSVLCACYVALRSITNNHGMQFLRSVHEAHFEYALNAASSQLGQLGTAIAPAEKIFEGLRFRSDEFRLVDESRLDMKMELEGLLTQISWQMEGLRRNAEPDIARKQIDELFATYFSYHISEEELRRQLANRLQSIEGLFDQLKEHFGLIEELKQQGSLRPETRNRLKTLSEWLKKLDVNTVVTVLGGMAK